MTDEQQQDDNIYFRWKDLPFVKKLFNYVADVRPGLQFSILYLLCARLSSAMSGGRAVLVVGDMGTGKSDALNITRECFSPDYLPMRGGKATPSGIIRWVRKHRAEGKNIEATIEDLSIAGIDWRTLATTLSTVSSLVSDRNTGNIDRDTDDVVSENDGSERWDVDVNSFSCMLGCPPITLTRIKGFPSWGTMWCERITCVFPIMTLEQYLHKESMKRRKGYKKTTNQEIREFIKSIKPENMKIPNAPLELRCSPKYYEMVRELLYERQHTEDRRDIYFRGDLSALALLNGRRYITDSDIAVYLMLKPNLNLINCSSYCQRMAALTLRCDGQQGRMAWLMKMGKKALLKRIEDNNTINGSFNNPVHIFGDSIVLESSLNHWMKKQEYFIKRCGEV